MPPKLSLLKRTRAKRTAKQPPKAAPRRGFIANVPRPRVSPESEAISRITMPENTPKYSPKYTERQNELIQQMLSFKPAEFEIEKLWKRGSDDFAPEKLLVFYGKRGTGKTFAATAILNELKDKFPYGLVLTDTDFNGYWDKYFPKNFIMKFNPEALNELWAKQERLIKRLRELGLEDVYNPYKIVLMDDCVSSTFRYLDQLIQFATKGRHVKCSVMLLTQYPKLIASSVRTNTDYSFVFFQKHGIEKRAIAEELMPGVDYKAAMEFIDAHTTVPEGEDQREILVMDGVKNTPDLEDNCYYYKPTDPGDFIVGCEDFWKDDPRYDSIRMGYPAETPVAGAPEASGKQFK